MNNLKDFKNSLILNKDFELTSMYDKNQIIESIKLNSKIDLPKVSKSDKIDGEIWYDNFSDKIKFPKLDKVIKVGWYAIVPHGNRKRICEITSVGQRKITVRWETLKNGKKVSSYACLKSHKFSGIIKTALKKE